MAGCFGRGPGHPQGFLLICKWELVEQESRMENFTADLSVVLPSQFWSVHISFQKWSAPGNFQVEVLRSPAGWALQCIQGQVVTTAGALSE